MRPLALCALLVAAGCSAQAPTGSPPTAARPAGVQVDQATAPDQAAPPANAAPAAGIPPAALAPAPRQVIYKSAIDLVVSDFDAASQQMIGLLTSSGGYVAKSDVGARTGVARTGRWQLRVPAERYQTIMDALAKLGEVRRQTAEAQDVTEQVVDLEARAKTLRAEEASLVEILAKQTTAVDILSYRKQITELRETIERHTAVAQSLRKKASLSEVEVTLTEGRAFEPPAELPKPTFGESANRTLAESAEGAWGVVKWLLLTAVAALPWLPAILPLAYAAWRVGRAALRPTGD